MPRIPGPSVLVSRIVVLLSYCWFTTPAVADEDDPLEFLNAMMAAHETDVSGTMSLVLSATVDNPDPSESEIASRVQLQETALRSAMASARTEQQRKVYQAAIAANAATVAEQVRNNADFELFGAFDRIGPFLGGDEKMSFQIRYGDQPEPAVRLDVIQRFLSASSVTSITYDVRARTCVIGTNAVGFGIPNPAVLGRLNPGMIDQLRTASGALASDDGTQTTSPPKLRVEIESQPHGIRLLRCGHDGRVLLECDVDIDKRYLCRRMATFGDNGQPAMLAEFRHFFQTPDGGVWFPGFAKYTTYGDAEAGVLSVVEIKLDAAASTASPRVIDSDLMIHLPGGTSVVSTQPGEESTERFELVCSVDVTIDQAWELAEHKCSSQPLPAVDISRTTLGAGEGSRVWWIIGINIAVVVVAAVCGLCFRRRKQRHSDAVDRAGHLLIAATLGFGVAGCSDTVTSATVSAAGAGAAPVKSIAVVPDRINFGRVAAGPQNTLVAFQVINNSDRLQSVNVAPGCGCMQAARGPLVLAKGESAEVSVEISGAGRFGEFSSVIQLVPDEGGSSAVVTVPVAGEFIQEVAALPDRLKLRMERGVAVGTVAISAPAELLDDIDVRCDDERCLSIHVSYRSERSLYCAVTARPEGPPGYEPLKVHLNKNSSSSVLAIPVFRVDGFAGM